MLRIATKQLGMMSSELIPGTQRTQKAVRYGVPGTQS